MISTQKRQKSNSDFEPANFDNVIPAIRRCNKIELIVYCQPEQYLAHIELLSGIVGKELPPQLNECLCFKKNEVTVQVHFGSNEACKVTHADVDLLLLFLPFNDRYKECTRQIIDMISKKMGVDIWRHSVVILTGVDASMNEDFWTTQAQEAVRSHIKRRVKVALAGNRHEPYLFTPTEKWFSKLWLICFQFTHIKSKPALLKIVQGRLQNRAECHEIIGKNFSEQPIEIKENIVDLPKDLKIALGIGVSSAIAGTAAAGALLGAFFGALTFAIPIGVAAGAAGVVGGGVGAGIASSAVGESYELAKEKQMEEIRMKNLGKYYSELLTDIPKTKILLESWAKKQIICNVVVAGIESDDVSKVAAGITIPGETNLSVHDFSFMSQKCRDPTLGSKVVHEYLQAMEMHLFIICIPMTFSKDRFAESVHASFLSELFKINNHILSNTVIVLSQANKVWNEMSKQSKYEEMSFEQYFYSELEQWKKTIEDFLVEKDESLVENFPVVPAGDNEPSINLSDQGTSPTACYHWLSELLLQAMSVTKLDGLPALIRTNRKRMVDFPDQYPNQETDEGEFVQLCKNIVQNKDQTYLKGEARRVHQLMIAAQCSMFSKIGLKEKKHSGQAVGLILGVNMEQNW